MKLEPWCDSADFLRRVKTLYIDGEGRRVLSAKVHKGMLLVLFEGVDSVNAAMTLKNKIVYFNRDDVKLPRGRFFFADILGATVLDEAGNEVGKLTEILTLPAQNAYVVQGETEHIIPAVPEFILETDIENKIIRVHLIEGM